MNERIEPPRTPNTLRRDPQPTYSSELPVLGISVLFESSSPLIMEAVDEAFGVWRSLRRSPELLSHEGVRARLLLHEGEEGMEPHAPLTYRMPEYERVILTTPGSVGIADALRGEVLAFVTTDLVNDRAHFRYGVLEALTLALLTRFDRQPLHASAIVRDGAALLLAGPAGVGKSTITYAAMRAGFKVLTDDAVYLQLEPNLHIWGIPGHLHLPLDAAVHFPELEATAATLLANGKEKMPVNTREAGGIAARPVVQRAGICVLSRKGGEAAIHPLPPATVQSELTAELEPGFDVFAPTIGEAIRRLAERGGWSLNVAGAPGEIVPLLHTLFDELEAAE